MMNGNDSTELRRLLASARQSTLEARQRFDDLIRHFERMDGKPEMLADLTGQTLSGSEYKALREALLSAFPSFGALSMMLTEELDISLSNIASERNLNHSEVVFTLIRWAVSQGKLTALVRGACNSNPGNRSLQDFAKRYSDVAPKDE